MKNVHPPSDAAERRSRCRDLDLAYAAHVVLALSFAAWRALEATPATSSLSGARFATSAFGRGLTFACIALGVAALAAIAFTLWRRRSDPRLGLLALGLCGAAWQRAHVDALDIAYVLLVALLASLWFGSLRAHARARA